MSNLDTETIIFRTDEWVKRVVIGYQLCPFAKNVRTLQQIRYVVSVAETHEALLYDLKRELEYLLDTPASQTDTTLLIHPLLLQDFFDYNDFLEVADVLLEDANLEGVFQVASFHPQYQFEGTQPDDAENYTNRSPYPMLHLLREESLERVIALFPDSMLIPERNIQTMNHLGAAYLKNLLTEIANSRR